MKRYFWSIFFSLLIGIYLGKFILNQYSDFNVFPVSFGFNNVYFLQQGVYSNEEIMKSNMSSFNYYIYDVEDDGYHTYLGITKNYENALKVKEYFKKKGYDIYIRENSIKSDKFISVLEQYDILLSESSDDTIDGICDQVLSSYEELVINEDSGNSKE